VLAAAGRLAGRPKVSCPALWCADQVALPAPELRCAQPLSHSAWLNFREALGLGSGPRIGSTGGARAGERPSPGPGPKPMQRIPGRSPDQRALRRPTKRVLPRLRLCAPPHCLVLDEAQGRAFDARWSGILWPAFDLRRRRAGLSWQGIHDLEMVRRTCDGR